MSAEVSFASLSFMEGLRTGSVTNQQTYVQQARTCLARSRSPAAAPGSQAWTSGRRTSDSPQYTHQSNQSTGTTAQRNPQGNMPKKEGTHVIMMRTNGKAHADSPGALHPSSTAGLSESRLRPFQTAPARPGDSVDYTQINREEQTKRQGEVKLKLQRA